jgi:hypothetical protein
MSIIGFAASYAIVIPGLTALLKHKSHAIGIQFWANIAITILVLVLGITVSYALLGAHAPSMTTIAWEGYSAGMHDRAWWTYVIEFIIILFPAINVLSASPMLAYGCSGNFAAMFKNPSRATIFMIRIGIWILPFLIACATHKLGLITAIAGIPCYLMYYAACSVVHIASRKHVKLRNPYTGWWSHEFFSYVSVILCIAATILTCVYIKDY